RGHIGEVGDGRPRLVAQAIGGGLLVVQALVLEELIAKHAVRVLDERPREQEHRLERPQVGVLFPAVPVALVHDAAGELDQELPTSAVAPLVLQWKAALAEALAEAPRSLAVAAGTQEALDRPRVPS